MRWTLADRRVVAAALVGLAIALVLAFGGDPHPTGSPAADAGTAPVARLRRWAAPVVAREPVTAREAARPAPGSAAPGADTGAAPEGFRSISLEDLEPAARARLGEVALGHLADLVDGCEVLVDGREDLGAFLTVDASGVAALDIRPIAQEDGPITVEDRPLSPELVECMDDRVWDQDWSAAGVALPPGVALPLALTMRLHAPD